MVVESRVGLRIMVMYSCRILLALGLGWSLKLGMTEKGLRIGVEFRALGWASKLVWGED